MAKWWLVVTWFSFATLGLPSIAQNYDEDTVRTLLAALDPTYCLHANAQMESRWAYITNITDTSSQELQTANIEFAAWQKLVWQNVSQIDYTNFQDAKTKRELKYLGILGTSVLEGQDIEKFNELGSEMEAVYSTARVCPHNRGDGDCNLNLDQDLTEIMATSTDYDELLDMWVQWRDAAGKPIRQNYTDFVALNNKAAVENGYPNTGSMWNEWYLFEGYSEEDFKKEIDDLWLAVKPLYVQLYTFVRRIMNEKIYTDKVSRTDPLPAHILGDMWAQSWVNIAPLVLPYEADPIDATPAMIEQGYDAHKMFETSETFFVNLGLPQMTDIFWTKSLTTRPTDGREVECHASSEDFFKVDDYRIKMCANVNMQDLIVIHHEMGHTAYFMQYANQHWIFRNGANPGFHEAIGDCLALSVSTPAHLQKIGLLEKTDNDKFNITPRFDNLPDLPADMSPTDFNYMMKQALDKVAFLPFGYLMDKWRWGVFDGTTDNTELNADWWKLRLELQGLVPPVERSENDFDPGAKFHIPANVEYIRYFVSYIVQFQFYEAMCKAAGQYDPADPNKPLYKCDFDGSTAAGDLLKAMLQPGFSEPWPDVLYNMTGSRKMDAQSILNYFAPLYEWLQEANKLSGECIGWEDCVYRNDTVPLIVGIILAVLMTVVVIGYFVGRARTRSFISESTETLP